MFQIEMNSEAGQRLADIVRDPATHKVSLDERAGNRVAIKKNEGMWSAGLSTILVQTTSPEAIPGSITESKTMDEIADLVIKRTTRDYGSDFTIADVSRVIDKYVTYGTEYKTLLRGRVATKLGWV